MRLMPYKYTPFGLFYYDIACQGDDLALSKVDAETDLGWASHDEDAAVFVTIIMSILIGGMCAAIFGLLGGMASLIFPAVDVGMVIGTSIGIVLPVFWLQFAFFRYRLRRIKAEFQGNTQMMDCVYYLRSLSLPAVANTALENAFAELKTAMEIRKVQKSAVKKLEQALELHRTPEHAASLSELKSEMRENDQAISRREKLIENMYNEHKALMQRADAELELIKMEKAVQSALTGAKGLTVSDAGANELDSYLEAHRQVVREISK